MRARKAASPARRGDGVGARKVVCTGERDGRPSTLPEICEQVIVAEIVGSDRCSALGITVRGDAPVLGLCRALIEAGHDPDRPIHAYRGRMLSLRIRSVGIGAALAVNGRGDGFARRRPVVVGTRPSIARRAAAGTPPPRGPSSDA
jgi:hypothetical protein